MALVSKVQTPSFFCENNPYMLVFFTAEFGSRFRNGSCENPYYMQVYDLRKIYPELTNVYEARTRFIEEMKVGNQEPIKLYEFEIHDLTSGNHMSIRDTSNILKKTNLRVGVYDGDDEYIVAKRMLNFCIEHRIFKWDD